MSELVEVVVPPIEHALTYSVPDSLSSSIEVGFQVRVPLGNRKTFGFVVAKSSQTESHNQPAIKLKPLESDNHQACFLPSQLKFFRWVADYYAEPLSSVIDVAIPPSAPVRMERYLKLCGSPEKPPRSRIQSEILKFLSDQSEAISYKLISKRWRGASAAVNKLLESGLLEAEERDPLDQFYDSSTAPAWAKTDIQLNSAQQIAYNQIEALIESQSFKPMLLHGVTGSGKTEVYIEAIIKTLQRGQTALVIVPEIALTPQLVDRFRARLGTEISVLHSALTKRARWDYWRALIQGKHSVAIGTRSAVFAPLASLGLIIVDEEHDSSFKQSEGLRYNARDLAIVRASFESCPIVLGSATPSLETFHKAKTGKYTYLTLPARPHQSSEIELEIIDLNKLKPWQMPTRNISPQLQLALTETLEKKQQAFILYNRRGFSSYLQCEECESVIECPNCSVTMTYHQARNALLCHYCSLTSVPAEFCPSCSAPGTDTGSKEPARLIQRGAGTEKIFDEIQELFPEASVARLDRDSASNHEEYKQILNQVRSGATQVLVGTQMIAKGHDLPGVTLVGVADCDVGLHMPDFRAAERVYQLLTQAAGRAGRGDQAGKVILQTRVPKHPSLQRTLQKDFDGFAANELRARQALHYPPYSKILRIVASSSNPDLSTQILVKLKKLAQALIQKNEWKIEVLGPAQAPLARLKTVWRCHLLFKSTSHSRLNLLLRQLKSASNKVRQVKISFDVDPQDML